MNALKRAQILDVSAKEGVIGRDSAVMWSVLVGAMGLPAYIAGCAF